MTRYPINEHFATFQGEGLHRGRRAYFVRLQGCDVACSFCDSASTWHRDFKPHNIPLLTAAEVRQLVTLPARSLVVLTGGEPALHNLEPLLDELHGAAFEIAIETAGHQPLPRWLDHIALSPKPRFGDCPLHENVCRADEFKIIIEDEQSLPEGLACLEGRRPGTPVWLHPEWSRAQDPKVLGLIREAVLQADRHLHDGDACLRAGFQMHKLYGVDEASGQARALVPLGGRRVAAAGGCDA